MAYGEAKVYFDGSHYIAIPHTTRPKKQRRVYHEELVDVKEKASESKEASELPEAEAMTETEPEYGTSFEIGGVLFECIEMEDEEILKLFGESEPPDPEPTPRKATRKELFEEAYEETKEMSRKERKRIIFDKLRPYFETDNLCELYVDAQYERKIRNLISRRVRLTRKANLQEFTHFCTFTYDSKLHTEESFRRKLKHTLSNFAKRKGWKYIGVWERSPEKKRLHFHGIFYIPEGTMPGLMIQVEDYSKKTHRRQITTQNVYFNEHFGRSDFEELDEPKRKGEALAYLMKYLEKSGEKIVYSKGLHQFFISDILDDDVVTTIGVEDRKLLLYDNFTCFDEGVYVGEVSPDVISQLRKCN